MIEVLSKVFFNNLAKSKESSGPPTRIFYWGEGGLMFICAYISSPGERILIILTIIGGGLQSPQPRKPPPPPPPSAGALIMNVIFKFSVVNYYIT